MKKKNSHKLLLAVKSENFVIDCVELNVANALLDVRFISIFSFNFIHTVMTNIFIFRCLCSRGVCVVEIHKKALQRAINHRRG